MTLPTFLGIGVAKAGTTWLYELLAMHPEVYLPKKVKDIQYFNHFYDRGIEWYGKFFPVEYDAMPYKAIGEFTAHYLFCTYCPERIARDLQRPKLLLILRNPIERTWSNYLHTARHQNYHQSFESFLDDYPEGILHSLYSENIKRYQTFFGPDQFLILLYDRVFADIELARATVAEFLGIDADLFPQDAGQKIVNKGYMPRYRTLYSFAARSTWFARKKQLHWPLFLGRKIGLKRLISSKGEPPAPMEPESRDRLQKIFAAEISELEILLQTDLDNWRS